MIRRRTSLFLVIFALSGFSGLIYESIWTRYLRLFLGHAAFAQTLVLAIFMGGMALGSALASRYSERWKGLLRWYAAAEGLIGLLALAFHPVFKLAIGVSFSSVLPQLHSALLSGLYRWTLSAILILPQSILLGMTFPLMSAGLLRLSPGRPGRTIALLYFVNSLGAAIGVLASGFLLIRIAGLPGTVAFAGAINTSLAAVVWFLTRDAEEKTIVGEPAIDRPRQGGVYRFYLIAALLTGTASFMYEIGWIRMLNLVLGTSTHSFELMLSAFILGLALGGLWIKGRIDRIVSPGRSLGWVQVAMGLAALATLPLYGKSFDVMQWLVNNLSKTDSGYFQFNLSSSAIALVIMLPATFFAGMTLPLITACLFKEGRGERSIGAVYAANTLGAILGIVLAVHLGMPFLGLKGLITLGASIDMALGIIILFHTTAGASKRISIAAAAACVSAVVVVVAAPAFDVYKMASGVYRHGSFFSPERNAILYHKDGATATVDVVQQGRVRMISTNGKVDAAMNMDPEAEVDLDSDEDTMLLLGILPMILQQRAGTAAVIGLGSGLTTQTLLSNSRIKQVDTVEIERRMVEGANCFRPRVELAFTDSRSRIVIDDAKSFFASRDKRYDIIVSEPSNPWVSGVVDLFTEEFYGAIGRHLSEGGLFVQWVQLYEIDGEQVASILKALASRFGDYAVYASDDSNLLIVATKSESVGGHDTGVVQISALSRELARMHIRSVEDLGLRKLGDRKFFSRLLETYPVRANSDYYPVLDEYAGRARFLNADATDMLNGRRGVFPLYSLLSGEGGGRGRTNVTASSASSVSLAAATAMELRDYFLTGRYPGRYEYVAGTTKDRAYLVKRTILECIRSSPDEERLSALFEATAAMAAYLTPRELDAVWRKLESGRCASALTLPERRIFDLVKAVGRRNPAGMRTASARVLEDNAQGRVEKRYALAAGMTGALLQGDRKGARLLWSRNKKLVPENEPPMPFRLLVAESSEDGRNAP